MAASLNSKYGLWDVLKGASDENPQVFMTESICIKEGEKMHNVFPWNIVQANTNGLYFRRQRTVLCLCERK